MSDLVKVKPLEWEDLASRHSRARAPLFGSIRCKSWSGPFNVSWSVPGYTDTFLDKQFPTLAEAKAAAQADYTVRILAALDLSAVEALEAENKRLKAVLTDALPWVEAQLDDPVNKVGAVRSIAARIRAALGDTPDGQ